MNKILVKAKNIKTKTVNERLGIRMKTRNYAHNKFINNLLIVMLMLASTSIMAQLKLESVEYDSGPGGSVEFHLMFDGNITKPEVFMTARPARLAFDMVGVQNASGVKLMPISKGNTKSIRIVSTNEKTRAVIDLVQAAHHELKVDGNKLIVSVFDSKNKSSTASTNAGGYTVENLDFRRGKDGQGKIIIGFNKPGALVNVRESAEKIHLEISSTDLPEKFDHKLDVVDFATPVTFVDVRSRNGDVVVDITGVGAYEHLAYQTGSQYVIEVSKIEETIENEATSLTEEIVYEGNKVSFNFQDIEVRSVLQLIADASQLNLVVADTVEGNVTLRLNNVPWDQALDIVLNSKQLDQRRKDNVIWIAPAKEIADREQEKLEAIRGKEEFEPLKTIYIQINYAKAEEFASLLTGSNSLSSTGADAEGGAGSNGLLSNRGSVSFDERTNTLLVSDIPDRLKDVEQIVKKLDIPVKQVQIESRIVIATDNFGDELGVKFGVTGSKEDSNGNILSTGGSLDALDRLNNTAINNRLNSPSGSGLPNFQPTPTLGERLNVNLPAVAGNASKWAFSILAADYLLDLELSALQTEGRGEVISTPRVVTTNQKEAMIKQGVEIPFEETAASPTGVPTISFKEAVLELRVTPLITPDDRVDLTLNVTKNTVGEIFNGVPSIDKREIDTRVLVGNGQTIVLGGVYEEVKLLDNSKVPVLGDIPGLGALFRNKTVQNDKAELLIFITPTIIKESL
ncbi:MAG: type IV pilus secretin PilQ [Marinicellaceae bacterium]